LQKHGLPTHSDIRKPCPFDEKGNIPFRTINQSMREG
jgi:hypothetical protein